MSSIGSLTSSTANSIRGYGGLASGLDRDTLIEGMTYGTTSKITKQQQKKQQLEWKQSAVRSITDQMIGFANKFTSSWSSSTNLFSSVFWGRNKITTTGANSKYVSVSGTANTANAVSIMGVKQLAQKAKLSSAGTVSDGKLQTGNIDVAKTQTVQNLVGESLNFKYGDKTAYIYLNSKDKDGNDLSYKTAAEAAKSINKMLEEESVALSDGTSKKLSEIIEVAVEQDADGKDQFVFKNKGGGGNALFVTGGSALEIMGFDKPEGDGIDITASGSSKAGTNGIGGITREVSFAEMVGGSRLSFTYNGVKKDITLADAETLMQGVATTTETDANGNTYQKPTAEGEKQLMKNLRASLQTELDKAFGKGRIEVGGESDGKTLSFITKNPTTGLQDTSSSLTLSGGSLGLLGEGGALNVKVGESTNLNLNAKLSEAGFANLSADKIPGSIKINGKNIDVTADDTMQTLIDKIKKETGVTVSYQPLTGKFTFTSDENGASGFIQLGTAGAAAGSDDEKSNELLKNLFGVANDDIGKQINGQDAIVTVKYAGSDEEVDLYRDSNTFTIDGLSISVKGEFGYKDGTEQAKDADGNLMVDDKGNPIMEKVRDYSSEEVEIDAQVDADALVDAVKSMVEEYNKIIEQVNKELSTKPDRDYEPLTSEQKKELSEDEIKLYEEKAKSGLLFGDSDLRLLSSDLRFIISGGIAQELESMGISTSSTYSDNGKLSFDESKFRAALESDPERVQELFTGSEIPNANGNGVSKGLATNLRDVMDKYVNTMGSWDSKGILVRKAGTESSPISITENYMYKQIAEYNKQIAKLQTQLEAERDRYIKQFTSLETLISQMNSQSNWLSQIGGSY
ncbi:MAG: flagellar filament capping protein FliD [Lachnospiraceae bacterium]